VSPQAETQPAPSEASSGEHEARPRGSAARRRLLGRVTSDKMDKTVVVEVMRYKRDAVYKKYVRVRKRYKAHDEKNEFRVGDRVELIEHRPLAKTKRWKVVRLITRPAQELTAPTPE
jgi:small subunit ribosomal protein S17